MKTPIFLAIAMVFAVQTNSFSQKEYKSGYIIRINGDSVAGFIGFRNRTGNGNACYYKEQNDSQETLLSPLDIKTFGYVFGERFDSKMLPVVNGQVFAKTLVRGTMSLYVYYDIFYIETNKLYRLEDKKSANGS